jgi:hypothetical protein
VERADVRRAVAEEADSDPLVRCIEPPLPRMRPEELPMSGVRVGGAEFTDVSF